jgi:hypothetical protein
MTKLLFTAILFLFLSPLTFAEAPADTDAVSPECEKIQAELKEAQAQHNSDYKAKGKAFFNWKKYHDELNSDSYLNTDAPLMDSVNKCEGEDPPNKDFCKGVTKKYNEISPKEKSAKEALVKAQKKADESEQSYNEKLREAAELKCIMKSR